MGTNALLLHLGVVVNTMDCFKFSHPTIVDVHSYKIYKYIVKNGHNPSLISFETLDTCISVSLTIVHNYCQMQDVVVCNVCYSFLHNPDLLQLP